MNHRNKRVKETIGSELLNIKGVGSSTTGALLKHFRSVKKIREANQEEISKIIGKTKGAAVFNYLKSH